MFCGCLFVVLPVASPPGEGTRWRPDGRARWCFFCRTGVFFFHPLGFSCLFIFLLFVKFISNTFVSQPCLTHSHQLETPTYCLRWVVLGFGWVRLEPHYVQTWKNTAAVGLRWVWMEMGWVGLEPRSLVTTENHPSVVLTAAVVIFFLMKNAQEVDFDIW